MVGNAFRMAVRELRRNVMRSALTMLGIVVGVAAVIMLVVLGRGATQRITADISSLGRNLLIVIPGTQRVGSPPSTGAAFRIADADAIAREVRGLRAVAPAASRPVTAVHGAENVPTLAVGTTGDYLLAREWPLSRGRVFTEAEVRSGKLVCLLGETVRRELFGSQDAVGASIRLGRVSCRVLGVLAAKGQSTFGSDQDDLVLLPLRAFQRRISGNDDVGQMFLSALRAADAHRIRDDVLSLLRERRHVRSGEGDDFMIRDLKEVTGIVQTASGVLTAFLGAIAAVSLLVGGIGIMNVMLVSVTERTREIGTRMAIGALGRDVLLQFLVEAALLASFGGAIGIGVGLGGSALVGRAVRLPFVFDAFAVGGTFAFSAVVGVLFGFLPARRAARLDPIDALRHE